MYMSDVPRKKTDSEKRKIIKALVKSVIIAARGEDISCSGKTKYLYKDEALANRTETDTYAHWCLFCGMYHVNPYPVVEEYLAFEQAYVPDPRYSDFFQQAEVCYRKTRFGSRVTAFAVAYYHLKEKNLQKEVSVYFCLHCGSWHIGRAPNLNLMDAVKSSPVVGAIS
jgi:hypothetical protein